MRKADGRRQASFVSACVSKIEQKLSLATCTSAKKPKVTYLRIYPHTHCMLTLIFTVMHRLHRPTYNRTVGTNCGHKSTTNRIIHLTAECSQRRSALTWVSLDVLITGPEITLT